MRIGQLIKILQQFPENKRILVGDYEENHHEINDIDTIELATAKKLKNGYWDYTEEEPNIEVIVIN